MSEKKSLLSAFVGWVANNHKQNAQALPAQLGAMFRGGRDDLADAILKAFPDSMAVSPQLGVTAPTPQQLTESLEGQAVDHQTDKIAETKSVHGDTKQQDVRKSVLGHDLPQQPEQNQDRSRGR